VQRRLFEFAYVGGDFHVVGLVIIVAFCLYTAFALFVAKRVGRLAKSRVGQNVMVASVPVTVSIVILPGMVPTLT